MKASEKIIRFIKIEEGYSNEAYLCAGNVWTIGWGHTNKVKKGDVCSEEQAQNWLINDLVACELCVSKYVDVELKQHEFDALVSLVFNVGPQAFINKNKTRTRLLIAINKKKSSDSIMEGFKSFVFANNVRNVGLVNRRDKEWEIYSSNVYTRPQKMIYAHFNKG